MAIKWGVPDARLILNADAPRPKWLAMRRDGVGGSDAAVITGASHYEGQSPYNLWLDKTSTEDPEEVQKDIFWLGHEAEKILAPRFTTDTGIETRNVGMYASKTEPWMFANPDRLTSDGGILEIKTAMVYGDAAKQYRRGELPEAHRQQLTWYMHVTGRHQGHIIALVESAPVILHLDYDRDYAEWLQAQAAEFWQHVQDGTPPPVDPYTVDAAELALRFPAEAVDPASVAESMLPQAAVADWERHQELKAEAKRIADELKAIETRTKAEIGDKEYLSAEGKALFRWRTVAGRRSFDKAAAIKKIAAERGVEPTKDNLKSIEDEFTTKGDDSRRFIVIGDAA